MPWSGVGAGGLGLIGTMISALGQAQANKVAKEMARENRKWMEKMSNTAHQREVADLRAAGLNPILSSHSSGASVPNSSVPGVENELSAFEDLGSLAQMAINTADSHKSIKAQIDKVNQDKAVGEATERKLNAETQQVNLQNEALHLDNQIKSGVFDSDHDLRMEDGHMVISKKAIPRYIQSVLESYRYQQLRNFGISSSTELNDWNVKHRQREYDDLPEGLNRKWMNNLKPWLDALIPW